jgi:hypothetical protein
MGASEWISLGSCAIAITAVLFSILTSKKRLTFTCSTYTEILQWYQLCIEELTTARHSLQDGSFCKTEHLAKLSSLIEVGRFYFPNKQSKDGYGSKKESAYQGNRDAALDFLVFSYDILRRDNPETHVELLLKFSRGFTSRVFDVLNPRKHNEQLKKNSFVSLSSGKEDAVTMSDILGREASTLDEYLSENKLVDKQ